MNFWRTFGIHSVSAVENILAKEEYTLEELLDEEELLQETKQENEKLLRFLTQPETLTKLFDYITQEPPEDADSVRCFKYPFIACEILCSDVWAIANAVYSDDNFHLVDRLYDFLDHPAPLNPALATHVSKVAGSLLEKKVTQTITYLKARDGIVDKFIDHLSSSAVMDLLLKVISSETPETAGTLQWLCEAELISKLVAKFDSSFGEEVHENASQALVDIIQVSMHTDASPLMDHLESEDMVNTLLGHMFAEDATSSLFHGLAVVIELLQRNVREDFDDTTPLDQVPTSIRAILNNIDAFKQVLQTPKYPKFELSSGTLEPPLGFQRLKVVKFCLPLFATNYKAVDTFLVTTGLLDLVLDLFFFYEWNNFLHLVVEQMVHTILEGDNEDIKMVLVQDCNLADRILTASHASDEAAAGATGCRAGHMGFITNMTVSILNASSKNEAIQDYLASIEGWDAYVNGPFNDIREIETKPSGAEDDYVSSDDSPFSNPVFSSFSTLGMSPFDDDDDESSSSDDMPAAFQFGSSGPWSTGDDSEEESGTEDSTESSDDEDARIEASIANLAMVGAEYEAQSGERFVDLMDDPLGLDEEGGEKPPAIHVETEPAETKGVLAEASPVSAASAAAAAAAADDGDDVEEGGEDDGANGSASDGDAGNQAGDSVDASVQTAEGSDGAADEGAGADGTGDAPAAAADGATDAEPAPAAKPTKSLVAQLNLEQHGNEFGSPVPPKASEQDDGDDDDDA